MTLYEIPQIGPVDDGKSAVPVRGKRFGWCHQLLVGCILIMLLMLLPRNAGATVLSNDKINGKTVQERALTISQSPDVDASYGIVMTSDGQVLWSRSPEESSSIASTTKIMTAIVALENGNLDQQVTVSENAASVGESSASLTAGSQTTLRDLLYAMMVESGNDAAVAVAEGVAGSSDAFVDMMNAKAAELNLHNTHFSNPNGLEQEGHHSCASDLAVLAQYAMRKQDFRDMVGSKTVTVDLGHGEETIESTDVLLGSYDGLIGVKTGFTDEAGYCFVGACNRDGLEIYSVVLGSSDAGSRFTSTRELMDWAYKHYLQVQLSDTSSIVANVPAVAWGDKTVPVRCDSDVTCCALDYEGTITQSISLLDEGGSIKEGDVLGTVTWTQGNINLGSSQLVAAQDLKAPNIFKRIPLFFKRHFGHMPTTELELVKAPPQIAAFPAGY